MTCEISIIIPAYNEEKCLPSCLDSIFRLDYPRERYEVIVVDNGSTDRTRDIALEYDIQLLRNDNKNVSGLRNLGSRHAKGVILAFVDADCIVSKDWLKNARQYFDQKDITAWGAPPVIPENATWVQKAWYQVREKEMKVKEVDWLESMNLFVRKDLFDSVGGFNESLVSSEDVDFGYKISDRGRVISDQGIRAVHMGEAATVKDFFKKEVWRGTSNFAGIKSHGLTLKELPSLMVPLYFGLLLPAAGFWAIINNSALWSLFFVVLYLFPSYLVLLKVFRKKTYKDMISLCGLFLLLQVYFFSRTIAVINTS